MTTCQCHETTSYCRAWKGHACRCDRINPMHHQTCYLHPCHQTTHRKDTVSWWSIFSWIPWCPEPRLYTKCTAKHHLCRCDDVQRGECPMCPADRHRCICPRSQIVLFGGFPDACLADEHDCACDGYLNRTCRSQTHSRCVCRYLGGGPKNCRGRGAERKHECICGNILCNSENPCRSDRHRCACHSWDPTQCKDPECTTTPEEKEEMANINVRKVLTSKLKTSWMEISHIGPTNSYGFSASTYPVVLTDNEASNSFLTLHAIIFATS